MPASVSSQVAALTAIVERMDHSHGAENWRDRGQWNRRVANAKTWKRLGAG